MSSTPIVSAFTAPQYIGENIFYFLVNSQAYHYPLGTDTYDIAEAHVPISFESGVGNLKCQLCLSLVTCVGDREENG